MLALGGGALSRCAERIYRFHPTCQQAAVTRALEQSARLGWQGNWPADELARLRHKFGGERARCGTL
ncbi:MAG TPA: hypothetical protein VE442_04555 [Jatrophihabitans sp.]|nr:hypothetical protein [Jatrophihabitans sp.]